MPYVMSPTNCPLLTALTTSASLLYPEHAGRAPASAGCVSCIDSWLAPLLHSETLLIGSLLPPSFQITPLSFCTPGVLPVFLHCSNDLPQFKAIYQVVICLLESLTRMSAPGVQIPICFAHCCTLPIPHPPIPRTLPGTK